MQANSCIVPLMVIFAAMTVSFAAGVNSADAYSSRHHQASGGRGLVVLAADDFDYFPSRYANQATDIEELPATF